MNHIVVGMGEALWDVLPEGKKIGGAPANFAYHVSQFGLESRVVSAVGEDKLGMSCFTVRIREPRGQRRRRRQVRHGNLREFPCKKAELHD